MTSKSASHSSDSTGLSSLAQVPAKISLSSPLLAAEITLPPRPIIVCWVYKALSATEQLQHLEGARRRLHHENKALPVVKSLLPSIRINRDSGPCILYVFTIRSLDETLQGGFADNAVVLDGLSCLETIQFSPEWLFACSAECSTQAEPCSSCLRAHDADKEAASWSSACLLPREPLRRPYAQFIHALRDRLVETIAEASATAPYRAGARKVVRLKRGFLLGPPQATLGEWSAGWDYHAQQRPLVYCELRLHLYPTRVLIHPVMHATSLLPLALLPRTLPAAGTPITLLPHGVPAYYLNTYNGPVGSLTSQFDAALSGLGVCDWKTLFATPNTDCASHKSMYASQDPHTPPYVIAWLAIQNRHGEDKGVPIVWPLSLCVLTLPSIVHSRASLKPLPMLPAQLLASPPAVATATQPINLPLSSLSPTVTLSEPPSPSGLPSSTSEPPPTVAPDDRTSAETARVARALFMPRSSASDSLRAFRSLNIATKDTKSIAGAVSTYVDAVAREREKERERLKRERDSSGSLRSVSGSMKNLEKAGTPSTPQPSTPSPRKLPKDERSVSKQQLEQISPFTLPDTSYTADNGQPLSPTTPPADIKPTTQVSTLLPAADINSSTGSTVMQVDLLPIQAESDTSANPQVPTADNSSGSYDPFSGFDSSWNQSNHDFMGMNLDNYDMGMAYSLGMNGAGTGDNNAGAFNLDDGFGVFTDDDFSFFDGPSTSTRAAAPPPLLSAEINSSTPGRATPGGGHEVQTSGPGPPAALSQMQAMPWLNQTLSEGFTPKSLDEPTPIFAPPPDLLPSTPTQTPPSHSAPVTPSVMLADQLQSVHIRRSSVSSTGLSSFDPIPFASSHKAADGKYALGKFALPSPPAEEKDPFVAPLRPRVSRNSGFSWQSSYHAATDPRIGIVRRLAGVKRKRFGADQAVREGRQSPLWYREYDEWGIVSVPEQADTDVDDTKSGSESGDDDDDDDNANGTAEDDFSSYSVSRPHTPPPAFLPAGPILVQTQFHHDLLLPMSVPLRHSEADTDVIMGISAPMSAPTPVSPAAILGAPSERSKALEGAAQILIREVIENRIWGDRWRASVVAALGSISYGGDVWSSDVRATDRLLASVEGIHSSLDIARTFTSDAVVELPPPSFAVAKSEGIIHVLPPALRFWEKLGLNPRAGVKNVTTFIFYEGNSEEKETEMAEWLDKVSAVYTAKNFGLHDRGRAAGCTRDGLVPIQFEAFRKTFVSFVASLPRPDVSTILYIVTPTRIMNLASSLLRQVLSAVKKVRKTYPDAPILPHLIPESLISGALHDPCLPHGGLEYMVDAVYDRALVPVQRTASRCLYAEGNKVRAFAEPAFALVSPAQKKATFALEAHPRSLDVFDRNYMLHVGYRTSECGKWLFAACIDQRGEEHDLKTWLIAEDSPEHFIVTSVWDFTMNIATKANVEWRVIICKVGVMGITETDAWISRLESAMQENQNLPSLHVSLVIAACDDPWSFIAPDDGPVHKTPASPSRFPKHSAGLVLTDISSTTYILQPKDSLFISSSTEQSPDVPYIPDSEDEGYPCDNHIRPILTTALIRVPAGTDYARISMLRLNLLHTVHSIHPSTTLSDQDTMNEVARNYHDLAVLTRSRWKLNSNPILPFHIAALQVMALALSRSDAIVE